MVRQNSRNSRGAGCPVARAAVKYTEYQVNEPDELMAFLMKKMAGISRTRAKALLVNRVVLVDHNIQTQYNFPLKPGMKVQVSKEKNKQRKDCCLWLRSIRRSVRRSIS